MGAQRFREYNPGQDFLLPPSPREWLPSDHLANLIKDVVDKLDLSEIINDYDNSQGGQAPSHPVLTVKLLLYAYCVGVPSSRRIEKSTYEVIPFRVLAANQYPDHDTIADFRKRHLITLSRILPQILRLCQKAGLVKLGHVALDGTRVKANASRHKAMSYEHMQKKTDELEAELARLLSEAEAANEAEDVQYGKGKRDDELPEQLRYRERRLKQTQEAKQALKEDARQEAQAGQGAVDEPKAAKPKAEAPVRVKPEAQRNLTDPDSRTMKDGATRTYEQALNRRVAVDSAHPIRIAAGVTQEYNDKQQVEPTVERLKANLGGLSPRRMTLDNGYYSDENVGFLKGAGTHAYIGDGADETW